MEKITHPHTLLEAVRHFSDIEVATQYMAKLRWPNGFECPACGGTESTYLKTRRLWKCKACKKQTSVKKGTVFEDSPIGLDKWLAAMWLIANCKNGVSSCEIARDLGVTQKTAWFMLQRIRLAMQTGTFARYADKFDGAVEVDETFIGGKARKMNAKRLRRWKAEGGGSGPMGKVGVMGFRERGGQVAAAVPIVVAYSIACRYDELLAESDHTMTYELAGPDMESVVAGTEPLHIYPPDAAHYEGWDGRIIRAWKARFEATREGVYQLGVRLDDQAIMSASYYVRRTI